ncbi:MAG: MarR family transcriptional regulator [Fervidobacterium sp.]
MKNRLEDHRINIIDNANAIKRKDVERIVINIMEIVSNFVKGIVKLRTFQDMSTTEFYIFLTVGSKKKVFNSDLANILGISRSLVSLNLKKLLKRKLVEFKEWEEDRRYTNISLSKKGEKLYKKFLDVFEEIMKEIFPNSNKEEFSKLTEAFEIILRLSQNFQMNRNVKK